MRFEVENRTGNFFLLFFVIYDSIIFQVLYVKQKIFRLLHSNIYLLQKGNNSLSPFLIFMNSDCFSALIGSTPQFAAALDCVRSFRLPMGIVGLPNAGKAHYISSLCSLSGHKAVILCSDESSANKLCEDLNFFSGGAVLFPARDLHFRSDDVCSREWDQKRIGALGRILDGDYNYIVATVEAACQYTISVSELERRIFTLKTGEDADINKVLSSLAACGYSRSEQVEGAGQFAARGGIVDFFSPNMPQPVRVEFWGDTIDSISYFDTQTQRRTTSLDEVKVTPSQEVLFDSDEVFAQKLRDFAATVKGKGKVEAKKHIESDIEKLETSVGIACPDKYISLAYSGQTTLFDYTANDLMFVMESSNVKQRYTPYLKMVNEDVKEMFVLGELTKGLDKFTLTWAELEALYEKRGAIFVDTLPRGSFDVPVKSLINVSVRQNPAWDGSLSYLCDDLRPALQKGYTCVVLVGTEKTAKILAADLEQEGIHALSFSAFPDEFPKKTVSVLPGSLTGGYEYPDAGFTLISHGRGQLASPQRRKSANIKKGKTITGLDDLARGDLVVHSVYGIGMYDGIKTETIEGRMKDYIKINFRGTDVLYIPVTQLDLISKYISAGDNKTVKLSKLGSDEWKKTKSRVKAAVKEMAQSLTDLYAKRQNTPGYAFSPDIDMQNDFERRFEYDETDDQLISVNQIKADMEKPHPMDRLLCGDVGFGKTEVALRAAFKCVADGKQCAILVPTTILASQHYQTIKHRFDGFPVEIEMLSRFRTQTQRAKIKKDLKRGSIDIVVGTHSIIASSVEFKDLGLLIVDEEQRFGVAQKEKLKQRFPLVDVLTLSATPIPRTLNMAMTGIRDMSVLEMPPLDRHPVQTYVMAHDMGILAQAMERELRRGGQVFYLHNRTQTISRVAAQIGQLLPNARIGIVHGQMSEDDIGEIWRQLVDGEIDILVCTTIIETGIDVPNANTLIIEDADKLGLAQLHQIRGRVGRSPRRAFAYFTYDDKKVLTEEAQRRLSAIREFTQFGSGLNIAMRDLEIRGAGTVLGAHQHGHLEAVGYDMYLQLLSQAVKDEQDNTETIDRRECLVDIAMDAHIPEKYIDSANNRLYMYKRIAEIANEDDARDVLDEFIDRFGEPPKAVQGLIQVSLIRNRAANIGIYEITQNSNMVLLYLNDLKSSQLAVLGKNFPRRIMVSAIKDKKYISVKLDGSPAIEVLEQVITTLEKAQSNV